MIYFLLSLLIVWETLPVFFFQKPEDTFHYSGNQILITKLWPTLLLKLTVRTLPGPDESCFPAPFDGVGIFTETLVFFTVAFVTFLSFTCQQFHFGPCHGLEPLNLK